VDGDEDGVVDIDGVNADEEGDMDAPDDPIGVVPAYIWTD
jgi:hypothetical protein